MFVQKYSIMIKSNQTKKDKKIIEEIAEKANIRGKIKTKHSILFTNKNEKYAIIVNKIAINKIVGTSHSYYEIRLINYENDYLSGNLIERGKHEGASFSTSQAQVRGNKVKVKAVKRFPDLMRFYQTKEKAIEEVEKIKGNQDLINQCVYEIETQEDNVENI